MKLISLILVFQLLVSSVNVCLGIDTCGNTMDISSHKEVEEFLLDAPIQNDRSSHSDEHAPCQDECACCMAMQVVIADTDNHETIISSFTEQKRPWVIDTYSYNFSHLIWHPPKTT